MADYFSIANTSPDINPPSNKPTTKITQAYTPKVGKSNFSVVSRHY